MDVAIIDMPTIGSFGIAASGEFHGGSLAKLVMRLAGTRKPAPVTAAKPPDRYRAIYL
jgi:hypothetical protein